MEIEMLKKITPIVLSLCLILGISVTAENTSGNENIPSTSSERSMRGDFDPSRMPQGNFDPSRMPQGNFNPSNMPEGFTSPEGDFTPPQSNESSNTETNVTPTNENEDVTEDNPQTFENGNESDKMQNGNSPFGGQMPGGMGGFPGNMQNAQNVATEEQSTGLWGFVKTYSTPITSVVLLALAFVFVLFYKRKNY